MDRIRLLIAGEDSSARRGLTAIFTSEDMFEVLGGFPVKEAVEKALELQPDAVLLDMEDDISTYGSRISRIKNECPCSLILALVKNEQCDKLVEILAQGVDGCLRRGIMRGSLVKATELACRAGIFCMPGSFKKMVPLVKSEATNNVRQISNMQGSGESLTKREMEILQLMARNYSNREIAGKLFISEPTVKTHVSSILRKLGQSNRAQAIVYSYQTGLVSDTVLVSR